MSKSSLQTNHMSEFLAQVEYYRALLQERDRSAALLRGVERRRNVAPDNAEGRRAAYEEEYGEAIAGAGHVRRGPCRELSCPGRKP